MNVPRNNQMGIFLLIAILLSFLCSVAEAEPQIAAGTASGTLTIDGKSIRLSYAYAMAQPNTFDKEKTDIAVILTEKPLPEGALKNIEELYEAVREKRGWAYFEIDENGKPITERIDHPSLGESHLMMSGFTNAKFVLKRLGKDYIKGSFKTNTVEDFMDHKYQIEVEFETPIVQAKRPEPLPNATTGKKLPPGGGEPGKSYMALHKAIINKDIATIRKLSPSTEMSDVSDKELNEALEFMALLTPQDSTITEGYVSGDRAVLYVIGTIDAEKNYATIEMVRKDGIWLLKNESWSDSPISKSP